MGKSEEAEGGEGADSRGAGSQGDEGINEGDGVIAADIVLVWSVAFGFFFVLPCLLLAAFSASSSAMPQPECRLSCRTAKYA